MNRIRPALFADKFYPKDENELEKILKKYLSDASVGEIEGDIKALIVPHAGYVYSGPIAAYGYKTIIDSNYKNTFMIGLSHKMMFQGIALANYAFWQTPFGVISATKLWETLKEDSSWQVLNEAHTFEHSIEVQLPFLYKTCPDIRITPLVTGRINDPQEIAKDIDRNLHEKDLIIVSSDLSHYNSYKKANEIDGKTIKKIIKLDTNISPEEACGSNGIKILIKLAEINKWEAKLLNYQNSGDTAGDKDEEVGYTSIAFTSK
jgi:MEMO1 family protein